jgi:arsenate reductase (glutaredoxin)
MKKARVYQYSKCSTCVKAMQFLKAKKIDFESIEITEQPPSVSELKQMLKIYDGDLKKLFNTSGIQYRELDLAKKLPTMSESEALKLLSTNGKLVKRPFLLVGDKGLVGFREEAWKTCSDLQELSGKSVKS